MAALPHRFNDYWVERVSTQFLSAASSCFSSVLKFGLAPIRAFSVSRDALLYLGEDVIA